MHLEGGCGGTGRRGGQLKGGGGGKIFSNAAVIEEGPFSALGLLKGGGTCNRVR